MKKRLLALVFVLLFTLCFAACESSDYEKAKTLFGEQKYSEALEVFKGISTYEDSESYIAKCEKIIDAEAFICENPIYFRGEDDCLHKATFTGDKEVKVECVKVTENGVVNGDVEEGSYTIDEVEITLRNLSDELTVAYASLSEDNYFFSEGFLTLNKIKSGLEGKWTCTLEDNSVYDIEITEDKISYTVTKGEAVEGPFEGSYELGFGVFDTDVENGEIFSYIIEGSKVSLRVMNNPCKVKY